MRLPAVYLGAALCGLVAAQPNPLITPCGYSYTDPAANGAVGATWDFKQAFDGVLECVGGTLLFWGALFARVPEERAGATKRCTSTSIPHSIFSCLATNLADMPRCCGALK